MIPSGKSSTVRAFEKLLVIFLMSLCAGCTTVGSTPRFRILSLDDVRIGMPQIAFAQATDLFFFDEHGHFGQKVQYNSKKTGAGGAAYIVHCRNGRCFGVEVKYPQSGIPRQTALKVMDRLLSDTAPVISEHDDE